MPLWLENPRADKKRRTKSGAKKRRAPRKDRRQNMAESRAQRSAAAKRGWATRRARERSGSTSRKRKRNPESRATRSRVARSLPRAADGRFLPRGRSSSKRKSAPRRRNSESFAQRSRAAKLGWRRRRRNPGGSAGDIVGTITKGVGGAVLITGSRFGVRAVPELLKIPTTTTKGMVAQTVVALGLGLGAHFVVGPEHAAMILAGGLTAPLEDFIVAKKVPYVSGALSGYPLLPIEASPKAAAALAAPHGVSGLGGYVPAGAGAYAGGYA